MKTVFFIIFLIIPNALFCQKIELIGGITKNNFHDNKEDHNVYNSSYSSDLGYNVGFGIENIKVDWLTIRFTLRYESYNGELESYDGGLAGGYTTKVIIDKSIISLGLFPLNYRILNRIDLNFGFEISRLIDETFSGTESGWLMGQPDWNYDLQEKYSRYSSLYFFGLRGRIAYDFFLSESIALSPQYSYYYGLFNEFDEFPKDTKSMRHYFCIGIEKKLK